MQGPVGRQNRSRGERRYRTGLDEAVAASERSQRKAQRPAVLCFLCDVGAQWKLRRALARADQRPGVVRVPRAQALRPFIWGGTSLFAGGRDCRNRDEDRPVEA